MNEPSPLSEEPLVALRDVPTLLPKRRGKKVHYSTVYRWVTKGARGRVLESRLLGGVRYTTVEALKRFLDERPPQRDERPLRSRLRDFLYGDKDR